MVRLDKEEPIAIIGTACRLPGDSNSVDSLWDMISNSRTGHGKIPSNRWDADNWYHPDPDRKGGIRPKHGYFIKQDVSHFDAPFFSTTAKEAAAMDPMKRLLLEVSYESIENAGIPVESLYNSQTGCYVGCMTNDYEMLSLHDIYDIGHSAASATSEAMIANRVSWFFGLKGPSLTLDTACSSSLYALHLACQSLKLGETNMSLVAGVNLMLFPNTMHQLSAMHMLSPEGISHTFDDRANGYGRGEGIACIVVKRLSDALRDGDTIRAVIRGTGANADGKTPSITQPSSTAQAELIQTTYARAGLNMTDTQYFECHGTGTPVGDPIELEAIASTLGASRGAAGMGPLYIGSVKPSVGHTEGCSGLAGILKALACLENGMLVPTYGVESLNPKLRLNDWNLALPPKVMKWPTQGQRRISVNSFGFGGANAHAILDDAYNYLNSRGLVGNHNTIPHDEEAGSESGISTGPDTPPSESDIFAKRLFVLSSKDQSGVKRLEEAYSAALSSSKIDKNDYHYIDDLVHTLSNRRSHLDFRGFCVASSISELNDQLSKGISKTKRSLRNRSNLLLVFTGQGAQWPAMGVELLGKQVFEESVLRSQEVLQQLGCQWNAIEELRKTEDSRILNPEFSQTLCTVLQVALVDLLRHWKAMPRATVGHSSGEIAAAYAAGYISHADAVKIAYVRGLSSASVTRKGAMLAAGISREDAKAYLEQVEPESAVVACVNSPSSVTLSGDVESIDKLEKLISGDGKFARKLKVETAYHSPHMQSVAQSYFDQIGHIETLTPKSDGFENTFMFSSLTGQLVSPEQLTAQYWVSNMCATVEFSSAVSGILSHKQGEKGRTSIQWDAIVEIGPHAALKGPVQQIMTATGAKNGSAKDAPYMALVLRGEDAIESSLTVAGKLWAIGHPVDLSTVNARTPGHVNKSLTSLPTYPWNHSRKFWHEAYSTKSNRFPSHPRTDLLGVPVDMQNKFEPQWRNYLRVSENPWIEDHRITGTTLYPAAGMLVMALEGALKMSDMNKTLDGFRFRDVSFERGLVVPSDEESAVETRLSLHPDPEVEGRYGFVIFSTTTSTAWTKHCYGSVELEYGRSLPNEVDDEATTTLEWNGQTSIYQGLLKETSAEDVEVDAFYDHLQSIGMEYGPLFRNVTTLKAIPSSKASHGAVIIPDTLSSMPEGFEFDHVIHPATMDAIFHLLLASFNDGRPVDEAAVPYHIGDMFVAKDQPHGSGKLYHGYGSLTSKSEDGHEIVGDLIVSDEAWSAPKLVVKDFALRQVTSTGNGISEDEFDLKKCAQIKWAQTPDFVEYPRDIEALVAMASRNEQKMPEQVYIVLPNDASDFLSKLASNITQDLQALGVSAKLTLLLDLNENEIVGQHLISLLETESPFIYSWSEHEFNAFKALVSKVEHMMWVTKGGLLRSWSSSADFAPSQGLLRVLRNEYTITTLPHLDLSSSFDLSSPANAILIMNVWITSQGKNAEMEYAEDAGTIHIPRAVDEPGFDAELQLASGKPKPVLTKLADVSLPLTLSISADGQNCIGLEDEAFEGSLSPHDVEIQVDYVGLGANDASSKKSNGWGKEAVGTVLACGERVSSINIGQNVAVLLPTQASRTRIRVSEDQVAPVPCHVSPQTAATMPLAFVTAQYALLEIARLRRDEAVLINVEAGDITQTAIQVVQLVGASVFVLVKSKAEKELLSTEYDLPSDRIFDVESNSFVAAIKKATKNRGVQVILNQGSTRATEEAVNILSDFGYLVDLIGSSTVTRKLALSASTQSASLIRIDMDSVIVSKPDVVNTLVQRTFRDYCRRYCVRPVPGAQVFSVENIAQAIQAVKTDAFSKVVVSLDREASILTTPPPAPELVLDAGATFVLAGGLGALGLNIAKTMVAHGAKDLVFLSRSGGSSSQKELDEFRQQGVRAEAFKCDVTQAFSVASVFQELKTQGRVVKGVIQCAMVLEDTIFENMTHDKWLRAFLPKTRGSRNLLANLWPADNPFFILLSSITGVIGNTAQANYASGNSFEDALAHYARKTLGIRATSIDVGLVSDSSHFTESGEFGDLKGYLNRYQHGWTGLQTTVDELLVCLRAIMRGSTADEGSIPAQFVLGLGGKLVRKAGGTGFERDRKFDLRVIEVADSENTNAKEESVSDKLSNAVSLAEAAEAVEATLKWQIAIAVGVETDEVDSHRALPEFGVDSLNAVEIRNRVLKDMQSEISVFELLSSTPMADLAIKIASRSALLKLEVVKEG
ncbi:unnamed protein product [Clonostachys byssicola]|uniref:Uncharacterized protein n=1 Tax=Clonostachys byssicola TaxID=160290 RepID=A0A9N9TYI6_9HYPO|nr:unnamed protein product [Clonostachys byssicola]